MASQPEDAERSAPQKAPPLIEAFVRQLAVANKAVSLYPPTSSIPKENAAAAVVAEDNALEEFPDLTLAIAKQGLFFDDAPIFPGQPSFLSLAKEFYNRRLALMRFHAGMTAEDLIAFLGILKNTPEEIAAAGGYEAMMWEHGIGTITVVETQVTLIDQTDDEDLDNDTETPVTAVQVRSNAPRTRERIELARVLSNERKVRDYLTEDTDENGDELTLTARKKRFAELAKMAHEARGTTSDQFVRMFAQALWALSPNMRRELMEQAILPDARTDEALAGTVRRIDLDEIMRMLAQGDDEFDARRTGFARALKNLVQITAADRQTVGQAARSAMRDAGASDSVVTEIINEAAPTRLTVRRASTSPRTMDGAASMVLQLIDQAPLSKARDGSADPELAALQEEAKIGITEADVIAALVALAGLDPRPTQFANTMSVLEDSLDALVTKGELEVAAEAAITLIHAARNPALDRAQTQRLENAITKFARPDDIRVLTHALRIYAPGQPEYEAAQRLLQTLGVFAVRPLLEQLAEEPDRAERKALVDLISKEAHRHVKELASHISDPRWYFVRNIAAILGATKSADALMPLEHTLKHSEPRVRRESIRSLSMIHDRRSVELLTAALDDDDANNVQLAARYLGLTKTKSAVPALEMVARGEGRGNRENGPRVEAIEALGRMGAVDALPTLQTLARKRAIIGAARVRELRTAAQSAIAAINAPGVSQP